MGSSATVGALRPEMATVALDDPRLGMLIFCPGGSVCIYSKRMVRSTDADRGKRLRERDHPS